MPAAPEAELPPPQESPAPAGPSPPPTGKKRARVEEVEDEDAPGATRWYEDFPTAAGCTSLPQGNPIETVFEAMRRKQKAAGEAPWAPFSSEDDWDLARWLSLSGVSGGNINEFLKLKKVSTSI